MMQAVITWLEQIAQSMPLSLFALIGGIVEELIAPIPSPLVTTLAGTLSAAQDLSIFYLLWFCALATLSKTVATLIFYLLGYKLDDVVIPRFGKYIGVSNKDLERFGRHFNGTWKDEFILIVLRSIPVMPSTPISVICGILKIPMRTFFLATYVGFYIRNFIFMMLGYTGLAAAGSLMHGIDTAETFMKVGIVVAFVAVLGWLYWKRSAGKLSRWF